jgi:signal transduction histidine kinase/CheY-like chemotaxis protein
LEACRRLPRAKEQESNRETPQRSGLLKRDEVTFSLHLSSAHRLPGRITLAHLVLQIQVVHAVSSRYCRGTHGWSVRKQGLHESLLDMGHLSHRSTSDAMTDLRPNNENRADNLIRQWRVQILEHALTLAIIIMAASFITISIGIQGGPARALLAVLGPLSLMVITIAKLWKTAPLHLRAYAMVGAFGLPIVASTLRRGFNIPIPWVGALFVTVVAALVFDRRRVWGVVVLSWVMWASLSVPWLQGRPPIEDDLADISLPGNWIRVVVIYGLLSSGATTAILFLVRKLQGALMRSESLYEALEEESDRRLAELQQRQNLERQLDASAKMAALGRMTGGIAHDFNNLMQVISSNAELVDSAQVDSRGKESIREIKRACQKAEDLTDQMLTVGGKRHEVNVRLDVAETLHNCIELVRPMLPDAVRLQVDIGVDLPEIVGPSSCLDRIIMNLVLNARDAMPQGGLIRIQARKIQRADPPSTEVIDFCVLSVEDQGVGMDGETLQHALEPFFTTKEVGKGTGLGLAIVHSIAKNAGGMMEIRSTLGEGTVVDVYLRIHLEGEGRQEAETSPPPVLVPMGMTLLVIDDEPLVLKIMEKTLRNAGYTTVCTTDGPEALQLYSADPSRFAAVVTDAMMPGVGGRALYDEMNKVNSDVRVLVVSGYTADVFEADFFGPANRTFLHKPFSREQFLLALETLLLPPQQPDPRGQ